MQKRNISLPNYVAHIEPLMMHKVRAHLAGDLKEVTRLKAGIEVMYERYAQTGEAQGPKQSFNQQRYYELECRTVNAKEEVYEAGKVVDARMRSWEDAVAWLKHYRIIHRVCMSTLESHVKDSEEAALC